MCLYFLNYASLDFKICTFRATRRFFVTHVINTHLLNLELEYLSPGRERGVSLDIE